MADNLPLTSLTQLAMEVGGDSALSFQSKAVKVANATPIELARALRTYWLGNRWELHVLLQRFGWVPPEWAPFTGAQDAELVAQHLNDHMAWGEVWILFESRLGFPPPMPSGLKKQNIQSLVRQFSATNSLSELVTLIQSDTHPLTRAEW